MPANPVAAIPFIDRVISDDKRARLGLGHRVVPTAQACGVAEREPNITTAVDPEEAGHEVIEPEEHAWIEHLTVRQLFGIETGVERDRELDPPGAGVGRSDPSEVVGASNIIRVPDPDRSSMKGDEQRKNQHERKRYSSDHVDGLLGVPDTTPSVPVSKLGSADHGSPRSVYPTRPFEPSAWKT